MLSSQKIERRRIEPEARPTDEDKIALVMAEFQLQQNQVCRCGADLAALEHIICPDCD